MAIFIDDINNRAWMEISKCILIYKLPKSDPVSVNNMIWSILKTNPFVDTKIFKTNFNFENFESLMTEDCDNFDFDKIEAGNNTFYFLFASYPKRTNFYVNKNTFLLVSPKYYFLSLTWNTVVTPLFFQSGEKIEQFYRFLRNIELLSLKNPNKIERFFDSANYTPATLLPYIKGDSFYQKDFWNILPSFAFHQPSVESVFKQSSLFAWPLLKKNQINNSVNFQNKIQSIFQTFPPDIEYLFFTMIQTKKHNLCKNQIFKSFLFDKKNRRTMEELFKYYNTMVDFQSLNNFEKFLIYEFGGKRTNYKVNKENKALKSIFPLLPPQIQTKYKKYIS